MTVYKPQLAFPFSRVLLIPAQVKSSEEKRLSDPRVSDKVNKTGGQTSISIYVIKCKCYVKQDFGWRTSITIKANETLVGEQI